MLQLVTVTITVTFVLTTQQVAGNCCVIHAAIKFLYVIVRLVATWWNSHDVPIKHFLH